MSVSGEGGLEGRDSSAMDRSSLSSLDSWPGAAAFYLTIALLVTLSGLGSTGLVSMEGMVAYAAENMLENGDLLLPELYGELYTYKPPLVYWLAALSIGLFGPTELAVRLPGAVSTVVMGLVVLVLIGRVTKPRLGLFAALAATTGLLWNQKVNLGEFDTVLASLVGIAVAAACYNLAAERAKPSTWIWLLAYLALAAAFLAKGMLALMAFGPGLLGAAIFSRQTRQLTRRGHLAGVALFAVLIGAYLALLWSSVGSAAFDQPLDEARKRGLEWTLETVSRTFTKPLVILAAFVPWSLCWFWSSPGSSWRVAPAGPEERLQRAAWAFLVGGTLVFMAVPTDESRYYLPLSVAAGIVSAHALERLAQPTKRASRFFHGLGLVFAILVMTLALGPTFSAPSRVLLLVVGITSFAVVEWLHRDRPRYRIAYVLLVGALCSWTAENWAFRPHRARFRVLESAAKSLDAHLPEGATVWAFGVADVVGKSSSLYFYLDRPVRTFHPGGPLPAVGSFVVLSARELRSIEEASPAEARRLELIHRVHDPWRLFLLYRVGA